MKNYVKEGKGEDDILTQLYICIKTRCRVLGTALLADSAERQRGIGGGEGGEGAVARGGRQFGR
jgi:hypothetical protein